MPRFRAVIVAGFLALLLNSAYLAAFADPSLWYYTNVALHPILGLLLALAVAKKGSGVFCGGRQQEKCRQEKTPDPFFAAVFLALGLLLGVVVLILGATRPFRPLVYAHVALSTLGSALVVVQLWRTASASRSTRMAWAIRASLAIVVVAAVAATAARTRHDAELGRAYRIVNPLVPPASMEQEGRGPGSPFFPSSADTNVRGTIPANFFMTSETCGRCHRDIYEQWKSSAHHFSSFNNQWYRKSIEYMQDTVGTKPSKWCAGCHDHAVFFNGRFDRPIKEQIETPGGAGRASPARRATRSSTWAARWARATSRSSIRRCTISPPARTPCCGARTTRSCTWRLNRIARRSSSRSTASRPRSSARPATRCTSTCR